VSVSEVLAEYAGHHAERGSPLTLALLQGAARDWDAGGVTREVLSPYENDPPGSALPLRFTAALHRLVLDRQAPELALHYPTAGGQPPPEAAWPAARRLLAQHTGLARRLVGLPCQTNEVGRCVSLLVGLRHIARRTGRPLRLLEVGASAGLNLLIDRYRYGQSYGPPDSPCRLPDPGPATGAGLRIVERAGCDPHPLDPTSGEGRLRLSASVWGDQVDRFARQQGALAVAGRGYVPVEAAGAADWLARRLPDGDLPDSPVTVVWHSIVRQYVDPAEWEQVEQLSTRPGVWRLSYEPDRSSQPVRFPLRVHGPGTRPGGDTLAYGGGHGPPLSLT